MPKEKKHELMQFVEALGIDNLYVHCNKESACIMFEDGDGYSHTVMSSEAESVNECLDEMMDKFTLALDSVEYNV